MLPPEFREVLLARSEGGRLVLTTSYDNCIVGYPWPDWMEFEEKLHSIKNAPDIVRDFRRLVVGGAEIVSADAQGRIRLSKEQLIFAGIEKEAVLQGDGPRFEIWNAGRLEQKWKQDFRAVEKPLNERGVELVF